MKNKITESEKKYVIGIAVDSKIYSETRYVTENLEIKTEELIDHIKVEMYQDRWRNPKDTVYILEQLVGILKAQYLE